MFNSIVYNLSEGFKNVWRNKTMALASIASVAASLFVLGILLSIVLNINHFVLMAQQKFDDVQVFIVDDADAEDITALKSEIETIDHVRKVDFESKEMALDKLKARWGEDAYLLEGLENRLQNSLIIELDHLKYSDSVVEQIKEDERIDSINYYKDMIDRLLVISKVITMAGFAVIVLLFVIALFVIANTIKIVLYARKREISIMKYVGATNWFIRWPSIIEGVLLGFIGSAVSLGCVFLLYHFVYMKLGSKSYTIIGNSMLPIDVMFSNMAIIFLSSGSGIGFLGSLVSLRRHLKV